MTGITTGVSVLFARSDSVYKQIVSDVWDKDRDARLFDGSNPVVAHPPCRAWGRMRKFANPVPGEKQLARLAVQFVRLNGGVLEHPEGSQLWGDQGLPDGDQVDCYGGFTITVDQYWWGHKARKRTKLYIVGCERKSIPVMPLLLGEPVHVVAQKGRRSDGTRVKKGDSDWRPEITKAEREHTPKCFALWLVELAVRCKQ